MITDALFFALFFWGRKGLRRCRLAGDCTPSRLQSSILNDTGDYIDPALLLSDRMAACLSNTLADLSHERRKVAEQADALEQQADEIEHELTRVPFWPSDDWLGDGGAGYDCPTEYEILPYALLSVQARVRLTSSCLCTTGGKLTDFGATAGFGEDAGPQVHRLLLAKHLQVGRHDRDHSTVRQ